MLISTNHALAIVAVAAAATAITRALPFVLFRKAELPPLFNILGRLLPPAMIATLVIYCIRGIKWNDPGSFLSELLSLALIALLYKWKENTVLCIAGGTICYMILIRLL